MRKSFVLHIDSLCILEELNEEQRGELFYAIYKYQIGEDTRLSPMVRVAFSQFRNQFERDNEKYKEVCEARKKAGSKGGKQRVANQANASKCKQTQANQADSDSKSDSDSKKKSDSTNGTRIENLSIGAKKDLNNFMIQYCKDEGIHTVEIENFIDYWKSATKNAAKRDWKATFRNHCRKDWVKKVGTKKTEREC